MNQFYQQGAPDTTETRWLAEAFLRQRLPSAHISRSNVDELVRLLEAFGTTCVLNGKTAQFNTAEAVQISALEAAAAIELEGDE